MTIAYRSSGTVAAAVGSTVTIPKPAGTVAGDCLIATLSAFKGSAITMVSPPSADWVLIATITNVANTAVHHIYRLQCGSAEPANYVFTYSSGPTGAAAHLTCLTPAAGYYVAVDVFSILNNSSNSVADALSVTITKTPSLVLNYFSHQVAVANYSPSSGQTERSDVNGTAISSCVDTYAVVVTGATGVKQATNGGSGGVNIGAQVALYEQQLFGGAALLLGS